MCLKYLTDIWNEVVTWCHEGVTPIAYGALYNWYAADGEITSAGWHIPTFADIITLFGELDPGFIPASEWSEISGGKLKETGLTHWRTPNTDATNEVGFNGRGSAFRDGGSGLFFDFTDAMYIWSEEYSATEGYNIVLGGFDHGEAWVSTYDKTYGTSIRPVKDSTILTHGQTGTYVGNDGKVYNTICMGTQEWASSNLAETKYRDGTTIPVVTDNATWAALVTGAMCYYNNDPLYL